MRQKNISCCLTASGSVGGRLVNFLLCRGEHLTILTYSYLEELATEAGFFQITRCLPSETKYLDIIGQNILDIEYEDTPSTPHTLIIEAFKD